MAATLSRFEGLAVGQNGRSGKGTSGGRRCRQRAGALEHIAAGKESWSFSYLLVWSWVS